MADEGATSVVVCPVGFVSDHLEILYDLDIEARGLARSLGVAFARTRSLDDDPRFLAVLAGVVRRAAADPIGARAAGVGTDATGVSPAPPTDHRRRRRRDRRAGGGLGAGRRVGTRRGRPRPTVHVLEAGDRVGGKLRSAEFAGRTVDLAADAFLARRPEATELCDELGLADQLVRAGDLGRLDLGPRPAAGPCPTALNLGYPPAGGPWPARGSSTPAEALAVARDLVVPHRAEGMSSATGRSGRSSAERLGRPVVERLVDPLIGGINAGCVDDLSAAAAMPVLIAASLQSGSLMRRLGRVRATGTPSASAPGGEAPVFWSLPGEHGQPGRPAGRRSWSGAGVTIRTGAPVEAIEASARPIRTPVDDGGAWSSVGPGRAGTGDGPPDGGPLEVDGVVLAAPAPEAAGAAGPPPAGGRRPPRHHRVRLGGRGHPVRPGRRPSDHRSGAPAFWSPAPRPSTVGQALITGCTYLGRKWPHLARPGDELIRVSAGRFGDDRHRDLDDDELTASVFGELADGARHHGQPARRRWSPGGDGLLSPVPGRPSDPGGADRTGGGRPRGHGGGRRRPARGGHPRLHRQWTGGRLAGCWPRSGPGPGR